MKLIRRFSLLLIFVGGTLFLSPPVLRALPEYAAFSGSNCMACHVGPTGGFGRKPVSPSDAGWITDKFFMSGDLIFMGLYDKRDPGKDRVVLFPMEGALHFGYR